MVVKKIPIIQDLYKFKHKNTAHQEMVILKETVKLLELPMKKNNPYLKGKHCLISCYNALLFGSLSLSIYVIELACLVHIRKLLVECFFLCKFMDWAEKAWKKKRTRPNIFPIPYQTSWFNKVFIVWAFPFVAFMHNLLLSLFG